MRAYVLVGARPGKLRDVIAAIRRLHGIRRANICWGAPDIFVETETADQKGLSALVDRIQQLEGVERTETHIAMA
jgi:DNA-binding Lrp family transcriptional regulator